MKTIKLILGNLLGIAVYVPLIYFGVIDVFVNKGELYMAIYAVFIGLSFFFAKCAKKIGLTEQNWSNRWDYDEFKEGFFSAGAMFPILLLPPAMLLFVLSLLPYEDGAGAMLQGLKLVFSGGLGHHR